MRLIDIINSPWAITPEMLEEIQAIYARHLRGEKIDLAGIEARIGQPLNNEPKDYQVIDGVAVLPIDGVIAQRMNLFTKISGGTSSQAIMKNLQSLLVDKAVEAIVLAIDSPGGTVAGTPELAKLVFEARAVKPILAFTDGTMASAAYWIGAAADRINISSEVTTVGSIGVIGKHIDKSKAEEMAGIKTTLIYAGRYKAAGNPHAPLSSEDAAVLQSGVDHAYSIFVNDIARFRGVPVEGVLSGMADGKVFYGSKAIDSGLVDGVATYAETIDMARDMARAKKRNSLAGVAKAQTNQKENSMNLEQLKAEHPELVAALVAEATEGMIAADSLQQQLEAARAEGAQAENQRIADCRAQSIPGHEALVEQLAFDGKSTGADVAKAIIAAEQKKTGQAAADLDAEANDAAAAAHGDDLGQKVMALAEFKKLSQTDQRAFVKAGGKVN